MPRGTLGDDGVRTERPEAVGLRAWCSRQPFPSKWARAKCGISAQIECSESCVIAASNLHCSRKESKPL